MSRFTPVHFLVDGGLFYYNVCAERGDSMELDDDLFPCDHEAEKSEK